MNDEELRAFLESATVGDDEDQRDEETGNAAEPAAEPTVVLPPAPTAPGATGRAPSFDELMGWGSPNDPANDADLTPIVLPGPKSASSAAPRQTPVSAPPPAAPAPPPWPVTPAADPWPPVSASVPAAATPTTPITPIPPVTQPEPVLSPSTSVFPEVGEDYEKIAVTGGERGAKRFIPWIIVGAGAVIALIVAVLLIGSLNGGSEPAPTAAPSPTTPSESRQPSTTSPTETRPTTAPVNPGTEVPQVEVGPIMNMPITHWGVQADLSQKLGDTFYNITGENLVLTSSLISSLPASCGSEWGMTRAADGSFQVLKPGERCAAAPELYDELWGLMDAMVKTVRPL